MKQGPDLVVTAIGTFYGLLGTFLAIFLGSAWAVSLATVLGSRQNVNTVNSGATYTMLVIAFLLIMVSFIGGVFIWLLAVRFRDWMVKDQIPVPDIVELVFLYTVMAAIFTLVLIFQGYEILSSSLIWVHGFVALIVVLWFLKYHSTHPSGEVGWGR